MILQKAFDRAVTLIEVIVAMVIIAILAGLLISTLSGLRTQDEVVRAAQQVYEDLMYIRSRAVSTNQNYRINFLTPTTWKLEAQDPNTSAWGQIGDNRSMIPGISVKTTGTGPGTYSNTLSNLQATPRGLFVFTNSASGSPYATITGFSASTRSVYVDVGGAVSIRNP